MDLAHQRGLKVIYSVKDAYFGTKLCPKEIASEEDELVFIKAKIDAFREHPAWVVVYQVDSVRDYMPTFHVIGTDPVSDSQRRAGARGTSFALGTTPSRVRDHRTGNPVKPDESGRVSVDLPPLAVRIFEVH